MLSSGNTYLFTLSYHSSHEVFQLSWFFRVWYFADIFPNPAARAEPQILRVKTFVPLKEERFDQLLTRTNDFLQKETMGGMCEI